MRKGSPGTAAALHWPLLCSQPLIPPQAPQYQKQAGGRFSPSLSSLSPSLSPLLPPPKRTFKAPAAGQIQFACVTDARGFTSVLPSGDGARATCVPEKDSCPQIHQVVCQQGWGQHFPSTAEWHCKAQRCLALEM